MTIALDIDGTLLNYGSDHGESRINVDLVDQLPRHARIVLVTNQGGLPFGLTNPKFPAVPWTIQRWAFLYGYMARQGKPFVGIYACCYHPRAAEAAIQRVAYQLRGYLAVYPVWRVYTTARARKPSPLMLRAAGATCYYGDADEDEQAAAVAEIPFVRVRRFA